MSDWSSDVCSSDLLPAHTLKGESHQFGAGPLALLSERIEMTARACVESRDDPSEALELVVQLRPLFERTLEMLEREANPLVQRDRKSVGEGKSVFVRVDLGGRRIIKKKNTE